VSRFRVFPPAIRVSWTGRGSGDGSAEAAVDGTPYAEAIRVPYPAWNAYNQAATTGTNYYVDGVNGSDANNGLTTGTAKATFLAAYTLATTGDTINMLAGAVPSGMPDGSIGEYHEGELGTLSKAVTIQAYNGATVVFDGRVAPLGSWTQEGGVARYYAAFTSSFSPCLNSGQGSAASTNQSHANTAARFLTNIDCLTGFPVTKNGTMIRPAASNAVSTLTRSGTTATCVTSAAHGLSTGDTVAVYNVDDPASYNAYSGCFAVTVVNATTFTYTVTVAGANPLTPAISASAPGIRWVSKYQVVGTDTYFHDRVNNRLYVGFDPTGHVVRAADKREFATFSGAVTVKGIVWRCYAGRYGDSSHNSIIKFGAGQTWINCAAGFTSGECWNGTGAGTVFRDCQAFWTRTGWSSLANVTLYRCSGRYFNWFYGDVQGWHCGLVKVVVSGAANATIRECHGEYANGPIFWQDYGGNNNKFVNNRAKYAMKFGFSNEKCSATSGNESFVAGNLSEENYWGAVSFTGSRHIRFFNNTSWRDGMARMFDDSRAPSHNAQGGQVVVKNNAFVAATGSAMPGFYFPALIQVNDAVADGVNASTWFAQFDYNAIHYPSNVTAVFAEVVWDAGGATVSYTHAQWVTAMASLGGFGANHLRSTSTSDVYLTAPGSGNFTPTATALAGGTTLPAAEAAALGPGYGLSTTASPGIGARFYPGVRG
jgi:hypothetical protein